MEHCLLSRDHVFARHLVNVALHLVISFQLYFHFRRFLPKAAVLGTLLFALHPIQTEAVISLYGRADLLSTLLTLSALYLWSANHNCEGLLVAAVGILAKETSIVSFPLMGLYSFLAATNSLTPKTHFKNMVSADIL